MYAFGSLLFLFGFFVGIVFLQIYLSKKENKWLGLILPFITLCFSILVVLSMATYMTSTKEMQTIGENGEVIERVIESTPKKLYGSVTSAVFNAISIFFVYNIPTAILLAIYKGSREKFKKNVELEKMNILDLE